MVRTDRELAAFATPAPGFHGRRAEGQALRGARGARGAPRGDLPRPQTPLDVALNICSVMM